MNDIKYNPDELLEKQFAVVNKGYSPREVDAFLDEVISDYESIKEIEEYYKVQNIALKKTNSILRAKVEDLEMQLEMSKGMGFQKSATNIDLIRKIARLEGELYQTKLQLEEVNGN